MSSEFLLRFHQETGPRSGSSWCSIVAFLLCVLVCVYAIFPSESSSERLSLFVRLGFLCLMAVLAILFGEVRRELVWIFCGLAFYYVFVIVWSNSPYFTPRLVNLVASILCAALVIGSTASGRASAFALRVVGGLLVFSAAALFLQAGIYLFSGSIFEMHGLVFPWGISRSSEIERFGIARLSGLHTEPGTHSVYTVGLLILRCMLGGRLFRSNCIYEYRVGGCYAFVLGRISYSALRNFVWFLRSSETVPALRGFSILVFLLDSWGWCSI